MKNKIFETIIIGAGAAGLGCARTLKKKRRDFLVITENIGGRIESSHNGLTNYGAYFVLSNYDHILPLVKKGERLHPFFVEFHDGRKHGYHLLKMLGHPLQALRLLKKLIAFKSHYATFKKECENRSQKKVIESNPYLKKLYTQTAEDFIREAGITQIAKKFLAEGVYMCTFLPLSQVSAFDFLRLCLGLLLPAHEFVFLPKKAVKGFEERIVMDTVTRVEQKEMFVVTTKKGKSYTARNLVVATPTTVAQKLVALTKCKKPANAFVFHISGILKPRWRAGQFELFNSDSPVIFIRKQFDGTYIFYSKDGTPKFADYFVDHRILFSKKWEPAFTISGTTLIEADRGKGLYIIGDHNVIGLEDSYITGIWAGNTIAKSRQGS